MGVPSEMPAVPYQPASPVVPADSVGALLTGLAQTHTAVAGWKESRVGPFRYWGRAEGAGYEVQVRLNGGRLLRVWRNPLKRTIVFEGELHGNGSTAATSNPQDERKKAVQPEQLHLQIPAGFDLQSPPMHVERRYNQGECRVVVARGRG